MEYVNEEGRQIRLSCARCRVGTWVSFAHMKADPSPIICEDCRRALDNNPALAEAEFQRALAVSRHDSLEMRARWLAADTTKARTA